MAPSKSKGQIIRERYEATYTGYDELYRAEQYEKYRIALAKVEPRGIVLDAGCGTGLLIEYARIMRMLDDIDLLVCLDYSSGMLKIASWRINNICPGKCIAIMGNVERLPFPDNSFDTVYSFTVLDLVDDLDKAISELVRVSRGPVVASMLKKLPYKDYLIQEGYEIIGYSDKDVIFRLDSRIDTKEPSSLHSLSWDGIHGEEDRGQD